MDYLEGVVPEDMRTILDSHVGGCAKCTAFVASYLATPRILRDATAAAMPPGLERSLLGFLRVQRGDGRPSEGLRGNSPTGIRPVRRGWTRIAHIRTLRR